MLITASCLIQKRQVSLSFKKIVFCILGGKYIAQNLKVQTDKDEPQSILQCTWSEPEDLSKVVEYKIEWEDLKTHKKIKDTTKDTKYKITGLLSGTEYTVKIFVLHIAEKDQLTETEPCVFKIKTNSGSFYIIFLVHFMVIQVLNCD